jgi:hypothetical protein
MTTMLSSKLITEPIDKAALTLIGALSVVMAGLVWGNLACRDQDHCWLENRPKVIDFSWQDRQLGAADKAFILTFDRPMDHQTVEKNLVIHPPLAGKFSWAGRKLAYTLDAPIAYGEKYQVQLTDAKEHFYGSPTDGKTMQSFIGEFRSRDRAFAYIGTEGIEQGRLIYYNLTQQKKLLLTPSHLTVVDFKFNGKGDRVIFSAADKTLGFEGLRQLKLYSLELNPEQLSQSIPEPTLVLDNKDYQNNQFDIAADGKTIVVQRLNRQNPADFDLWMLKEDEQPTPLKVMGGDFKIAPDSQSLAVARGEGIGILPLQAEAKPLDFLPKFGQLLNFSPDGTAAALINYNTDSSQKRYQRSLFYVNNRGVQKELLNTNGSIINCQFTGNNRQLYCLLTELLAGPNYQERPYFAKIDLQSQKVTPLVALPEYRDTKVSLSPDSLALLFDQVLVNRGNQINSSLSTDSGESVVSGKLWLLIPPPEGSQKQPDLKELPLPGIRPQWAP